LLDLPNYLELTSSLFCSGQIDHASFMNHPLASIIIPVFNEELFLPACLDSVLDQSYRDIEIVMVNDCSTDNSKLVFDRYLEKDDRVTLVEHQHKKGRGEARNTGLKNASGKYIYFVDSDDNLPDDSIESLISIAEKYGSDLVLGGFTSEIDVDSAFIKHDMFNTNIANYPELLYNHSALNKLIRKERLAEFGISFVPPRYAEDILFSLKLNLAAESISVITKKTYNYRWGRQIKSATKGKVLDAQINVQTALDIVKTSNNDFLFARMQEKTAKTIFSSMVRAVKALNHDELRIYLQKWNKVLPETSDSLYQDLPKHVSLFCNLISSEKYESAIKFWKRRHFLKSLRRALRIPAGIW